MPRDGRAEPASYESVTENGTVSGATEAGGTQVTALTLTNVAVTICSPQRQARLVPVGAKFSPSTVTVFPVPPTIVPYGGSRLVITGGRSGS